MKKTTLAVTVELSPSLPHHRSIVTISCQRFFLLIPSSLVEWIDGNAAMSSLALERALRIAVLTSSSFRPQWTVPGRATTPSASSRPPLHFPPSTPSNGAPILEIGIIFSNSGRRAPSSIFPSPSFEEIEPSLFIQGEAPSPRHPASHRRRPSFADLIQHFGEHFTRYYGEGKEEKLVKEAVHRFTDGTLLTYGFHRYLPSMVAESAIFLARLHVLAYEPWSKDLTELTGYKAIDLMGCVCDMYSQIACPRFALFQE
uniref:Cyclin C-terminal domain-containing protein n=1 Tax=Oryza meridionalis TaxID=40149 RepID=A0A0E0E2U2_9ORYZ